MTTVEKVRDPLQQARMMRDGKLFSHLVRKSPEGTNYIAGDLEYTARVVMVDGVGGSVQLEGLHDKTEEQRLLEEAGVSGDIESPEVRLQGLFGTTIPQALQLSFSGDTHFQDGDADIAVKQGGYAQHFTEGMSVIVKLARTVRRGNHNEFRSIGERFVHGPIVISHMALFPLSPSPQSTASGI